MSPRYFQLSLDKLKRTAEKAWSLLNPCRICPRKCGVNRQKNSLRQTQGKGFCRMGAKPLVSSVHPHFGEEAPLVGTHGSGTIFFSSCNLACVYCQNWEISQDRQGREMTIKELAQAMIELQKRGCHNINLVSPTIWVPQILKALIIAIEKGLKIPLVYNTGGYDSVETLKLLEGIIDIYMPDMKYSSAKIAKKYSLVDHYWEINKKAVKEMFRQVGDLKILKTQTKNKKTYSGDGAEIAVRGLLVRHLVLPNGLAGTQKVMKFLASLSKDTYINIMDQYHPTHRANQYPELNRRIRPEEFEAAVSMAQKEGLHRFDQNAPKVFWNLINDLR